MRIAYITADRGISVFGNKGASVHVRAISQAFADLGHEVTIFAARRAPQTGPLDATIVKVHPAPDSLLMRRSEAAATRLEARELYSLAASEAIEQAVAAAHGDNPFDLVYERYALFSTAGVRVARRLGVPAFVEVNSPLVLEQSEYRALHHLNEARAVENEVFSTADAIFAVSESLRDYVIQHGGRAKLSTVMPNAVNERHFNALAKPIQIRELENKFVIGFVGSLKPWHGIDTLMEAFRGYARHDRAAQLLIIGAGPLADWIAGFAAGSALSQRITTTGWLGHEQLPAWLSAMHVAVAPYPPMDHFYFSPLKLYEYLACGVPVIASRIGQIETTLRDDEDALLVPPGSAPAISGALRRIRRERGLHQRLREGGIKTAKGRTWKANAQMILQTIQRQIALA